MSLTIHLTKFSGKSNVRDNSGSLYSFEIHTEAETFDLNKIDKYLRNVNIIESGFYTFNGI